MAGLLLLIAREFALEGVPFQHAHVARGEPLRINLVALGDDVGGNFPDRDAGGHRIDLNLAGGFVVIGEMQRFGDRPAEAERAVVVHVQHILVADVLLQRFPLRQVQRRTLVFVFRHAQQRPERML
jgi:hypothetical protein